MARLLEGQWEFETDAGDTYDLAWPSGGVTRLVGIGLPPASYATQRTPTQHGTGHLGFRLEDREVLVGLAWSCRTTFANRRTKLPYQTFNYLAGPLILRRTMNDQTVRELRQLWYAGGLEFDSDRAFETVEYAGLRCLCRDPAWYDPDGHTLTVKYSDMTHGVYTSTISLTSANGLTTNGDWYAFPTMVISGACTLFDLQSTTTGQRLRYYGTIADGDTVTLVPNPHPAYLSATTSASTDSVENYIYPDDDFGGFCLWPYPLATSGNNAWTLEITGIGANFQVVFTWEDRYQGV